MIASKELAVVLPGENPAGESLEYDSQYMEMESLAVEVPDSQIGDAVKEGRGADWKGLSKRCLELWKRTRDLRVAVYLTIAETVLDGLAGFNEGLQVLLFLVRDLWEQFYPRLDPDDDFDPVERINILAMLSPESESYNDPIMFILRFRQIRLLPSLSYTLRDLMIASNELETGGEKSVDLALLRAEVGSRSAEELQAQADLASSAEEGLAALCDEMNAKMKDGIVAMEALKRELKRLSAFYAAQIAGLGATGAAAARTEASAPASAGSAAPSMAAPVLGDTRADALRMLRKGAEYFQKNEPNSPIPYLVNRALRIADMNFMDLLSEIAPDAVGRGQDILGVKPPSNSEEASK